MQLRYHSDLTEKSKASDKKNLREFSITRPYLQQMLKDFSRQERDQQIKTTLYYTNCYPRRSEIYIIKLFVLRRPSTHSPVDNLVVDLSIDSS